MILTALAVDSSGNASATARRASLLAFQAITTLAPITSDAQSFGTTSIGTPLASRRCLREPVLRKSVRRHLADHREVRVERIQNDASMVLAVPDKPELSLYVVTGDEIRELAADLDDGALRGGAMPFEHGTDAAIAARKSIAGAVVHVARHGIDADQVSCISPRQTGGDAQPMHACRRRIDENDDVLVCHAGLAS